MRPLKVLTSVIILVAALGPVTGAAATSQTLGAGSAVTNVDRAAVFDALNYGTNGTPLSDFAEGGLFIRMDGDSWVGDGIADFDGLVYRRGQCDGRGGPRAGDSVSARSGIGRARSPSQSGKVAKGETE